MKRLLIFTTLLLLATGCSSPPPKKTLSGLIRFNGPFSYEGEPCSAPDSHKDIKTGSQIVLKNAKGEIVATGVLGQSSTTPKPLTETQQKQLQAPSMAFLKGRVPSFCVFPFTVENIPSSDFYTLEVGGDRREQRVFNLSELEQNAWNITLSVDNTI